MQLWYDYQCQGCWVLVDDLANAHMGTTATGIAAKLHKLLTRQLRYL